MIQPNELRIGNYVGITEKALHADGCNILNTHFEVTEIKKDVVHFLGFHAGEYYADIKPIPLTEEWLEEFGFEKEKGFPTYIKNVFNGYLIIALDGSWGIYKDEYSKRTGSSYNNEMQIKHVHQLQNLHFVLTGKELEIKND